MSQFCQCWEIRQKSASSETECTVSRYNTPLHSPPSTSRPVPCDGATARAPASPATPSTWTRSAAHPAACRTNCPALPRNKRAAVKNQSVEDGKCANRVALTAVDGQVDVAVLRSQDVCGRAAIQARRLRWHVDNLDGAWQIPWDRQWSCLEEASFKTVSCECNTKCVPVTLFQDKNSYIFF